MKTILIPIYKKHNINIFDTKEKTEEIRKTEPKGIEYPFKAVVYEPKKHGGCGKVIGEFIVDRIDSIISDYTPSQSGDCWGDNIDDHTEKACITRKEIIAYMGKRNIIYSWHITAPKRYDKPKDLGEFRTVRFVRGYHKKNETMIERLQNSKRVEVTYVSKAPQNYMRIEEV